MGNTGNAKHIVFVPGSTRKVPVKFSDEQAGLRAMRSSYLSRQNLWVAIEKCETEIPIKKGLTSPNIKWTRFPLTLAWAFTVHEVQGLSWEQGVVDFDLQKQRSFGAGQIYTALSRVKTNNNLYCVGEFQKSSIKLNKDALFEYERLKENDSFSTLKRSIISGHTIMILVHNVRFLSKHVNDIVSDSRIMSNGITGLTETQIRLSDPTCRTVKTLNFFNINFNNSEDKFFKFSLWM